MRTERLGRIHGRRALRSHASGFTLIELLIVIAIVAILATIAYSTYQDQIVKSRRAAAAVCLQERAQFMERFYSTNMSYAGAPNPPAQCDAEVAPHYTLQFQAAPTAKAYTLQAVPQAAQAARVTLCGTISLDAQGRRGEGGTATNAAECW